MHLTPMSQSEYEFWQPRSVKNYAADKKRANSVTQAEADKIALDDFQRLLPDGLNTKDNYLFTARNEQGDTLGFIWFWVRGPEHDRRAWICDVIIEEPFRGKGYGREIMRLVEQEVKALGLSRIGLHVFGYNQTAIGLYQSLGYETMDLVMEKVLP